MTWLSDASVARLRDVTERPDLDGTRYEILREIGRGGMGIVYEAHDALLKRAVALKVLALEISSADAAQRLRREAETIAALEHPGIIPVHDVGTTADGRMYYAMKLVRGVSLVEYCRTHFARPDLFRVFLRACEAAAYAHANGVVHCDIKPDNIMVGEFGEVLIVDWGVARAADHNEPAGTIAGTRTFMSPEQARGERDIDPRADVYSLGVVLRGIAGPSQPRRLKAIIEKATAEATAVRYDNAAALAADLTRFIDGEPVAAYKENAIERGMRWASRNRALLALLAAYLIMRAIVLLWAQR